MSIALTQLDTTLLGRKSSQNEFPEYLKCFSININQNEPIHASLKKNPTITLGDIGKVAIKLL